jgi:hypothetical protein
MEIHKRTAKKKGNSNESRSYKTHGEGGNNNHQGKTAGVNTQVLQQTVHLLSMPEI